MPLVLQPAPDSPLSQGDLLREVPFAVTDTNGNVVADRKAKFVLVVSRPCKALRDDSVVVAPVLPFVLDLADLTKDAAGALERARRALCGVRDGVGVLELSDRLYLGPLVDGSNARYAADLLMLSTVRLPTDGTERRTWLSTRRSGRLSDELLQDLHVRMSLGYSRLGFDDYAWFPDADLDVLISSGQAEVAHLEALALAAERAIQQSEAANRPVSPAHRTSAAQQRASVDTANAKLAPYLAERERRRPNAGAA